MQVALTSAPPAIPPWPPFSSPERARHALAELGRRLDDVQAGSPHRRHLLGPGAAATGDDRSGMTHAAPRGGGAAGGEPDRRVVVVDGDPGRRLLPDAVADLPDHHDAHR